MKGASVLETKKNAGRTARLGVLAALLITAGILVWQNPLSAVPQPPQPEVAVSPAPTVSERNAREASYEKDMAALQALTENEQLQQAVRDQAAEQLNRMVQNHQTELAIEEALQKAGFAPVLVVMQNDSLTVNAGARELNSVDSMTILSLCVAHSEIPSENIRIMTGPAS